jgi:hypothetical protein
MKLHLRHPTLREPLCRTLSRQDFQQVGGYKVVMNFTLKQSGSGWQ